jgi:hypothetical protein
MVRGLLFGATARREGAAVYLGANQSGTGGKKARRQKFCNQRNIATAGSLGREVLVLAADQFTANPPPIGTRNSTEAKTCALNERGVRPARGTRWYASSAANLLSYEQKFAVRLTVL